jgi:hypothetical protein
VPKAMISVMTSSATPPMPDLHSLHDDGIVVFEVHWAAATLIVRLASGRRLVATGLVDVMCSRTEPWGPSVSINTVTFEVAPEVAAGHKRRVKLEMQSGDVIAALCDNVTIEPAGA